MYGDGGERTLKMFQGDDHALTGSAREVDELVCGFVVRCAGVGVESGEEGLLRETLVGNGRERVEVMRRGGDLRGAENAE